jgi:hypothetical protein
MTREEFRNKNILFRNEGHVLTPLFGTCLANARLKKAADGAKTG